MRKKILFISHMYPNEMDESYGKVIHEQARSLLKKDYDIKVICPIPYAPVFLKLFNKKYKRYHNIPRTATYDGIEVYFSRYFKLPKDLLGFLNGYFTFLGINRLSKKIKKRFDFDLIHAHFLFPGGYAAMKISENLNVPFLTTLQATDLDITVNKGDRNREKIKEVASNSVVVISPSPRLKETLKNTFELDSIDIGYGIDIGKVVLDVPKGLKLKYHGKTMILSISRLIKSKGLEYNIYALSKLVKKYPNIVYVIIGDGPNKSSIIELIDSLGLNENVEILGGLSHEKSMEYITVSSIFSLPSWQETFGLVYLEAMANEKPVIGCIGQGFDGIIKDFENGFLAKPKDVNSIVSIVEYILNNPIIVKDIAYKGKCTALTNYTFDQVAEKVGGIYESITIRPLKKS